jgi:RNA polymerase sigma-70 factor (ECF subfamily)
MAMVESADDSRADVGAVFDRFSTRLIALARTRLDSKTQRKVDPEDVVQSAFRSFFTRRKAGQLGGESWDDLWKILVVFTIRKCAHKARDLRAAKRDVRREVELPDSSTGLVAIDRQPRPEEVATLIETLDRLLDGASSIEREIIIARLEGYGPREISERIADVSERRVYRVLAQVRKRLEEGE